MSILDIAIEKHMDHIVKILGRPFCVLDFDHFEIEGKPYHVSKGTFRNKISHLMSIGKIFFQYKSGHAYYSLPGYDFRKDKIITQDHAGLPITFRQQNIIYKLIKDRPFQKQALHDFRLSFSAPGIWNIFSGNFQSLINRQNKDISLEKWSFLDDIDVGVTIHHTDTVSISIACSLRPIAIDVPDLFYLVEILTRAEEKISRCCYQKESGTLAIPRYTTWIVKMWHFGVDSIDAYNGEQFEISVQDGLSDIYRVYTKRMKDGKLHLRAEHQEYPNKPILESILDKIYSGGKLNE